MRSMVNIYIYIYCSWFVPLQYTSSVLGWFFSNKISYVTYQKYCSYTWTRWVFEIMKNGQLILIVSFVKILVWKPNSFLVYYLFILITLSGFTQYTHYTCFKLYKKCYKNYGYQTPENVLKPIFKVVTKHQKMR